MNDSWLAVILAFGVTFAVMSAVDRLILHFSMTGSIVSPLVLALAMAAMTVWRERR